MNNSSLQAISTSNAPSPVGPYNQAVLVSDWLYCSGQIPLDPKTGRIVGEGEIEAETDQVIENIKAVLQAAGANPTQVVKTTIYLVDLKDFEKVNNIYAKAFGSETSPARACVEVSALPKGARVEMDCVAWLGK